MDRPPSVVRRPSARRFAVHGGAEEAAFSRGHLRRRPRVHFLGNTAASNWDSKRRKKPLVFRLFFSFGLNLSCLHLSLFRAPPNQEYVSHTRSPKEKTHHPQEAFLPPTLKIAQNSYDADDLHTRATKSQLYLPRIHPFILSSHIFIRPPPRQDKLSIASRLRSVSCETERERLATSVKESIPPSPRCPPATLRW